MSMRDVFPELVIDIILSYLIPEITMGKMVISMSIHCHNIRQIFMVCGRCKYYSCPTCYQKHGSIVCIFCGIDTTQKYDRKRRITYK